MNCVGNTAFTLSESLYCMLLLSQVPLIFIEIDACKWPGEFSEKFDIIPEYKDVDYL